MTGCEISSNTAVSLSAHSVFRVPYLRKFGLGTQVFIALSRTRASDPARLGAALPSRMHRLLCCACLVVRCQLLSCTRSLDTAVGIGFFSM